MVEFIIILFLTSFCSVSYELILAQVISFTLGSSISAYTLTIGTYLFAMGLGSIWAGKKKFDLLKVELWLVIAGLLVPLLLIHFATQLDSHLVVALISYAGVGVIGVITGLELPILSKMLGDESRWFRTLAIDYLGSFAAGLTFALVLFPMLGLSWSLILIPVLNLGVAAYLVLRAPSQASRATRVVLAALAILIVTLVLQGKSFSEHLSSRFIAGSHGDPR